MSRTRWGWLPISIALNLVLIGAILGWVTRTHEPQRRQALVTWQRDLMPRLTPADAAVVGGAIDRIAAAQATGDDTVHQSYVRLRTALGASPLDKPGMLNAFEAIRSARDTQQVAVDSIFFEELSSVSPEGRALILKSMEAESHRWHPAGGH